MTEFDKFFSKHYKTELVNPVERIGVVNTLFVLKQFLLSEQKKKSKWWFQTEKRYNSLTAFERESLIKVSAKLDFIDFILKEIGVSKKERMEYQEAIK